MGREWKEAEGKKSEASGRAEMVKKKSIKKCWELEARKVIPLEGHKHLQKHN